jgi:hypothetical protein
LDAFWCEVRFSRQQEVPVVAEKQNESADSGTEPRGAKTLCRNCGFYPVSPNVTGDYCTWDCSYAHED